MVKPVNKQTWRKKKVKRENTTVTKNPTNGARLCGAVTFRLSCRRHRHSWRHQTTRVPRVRATLEPREKRTSSDEKRQDGWKKEEGGGKKKNENNRFYSGLLKKKGGGRL